MEHFNAVYLLIQIIFQPFIPILHAVVRIIQVGVVFFLGNIIFHVLKCSNKYIKREFKARFYRRDSVSNERFKTMRDSLDNYFTYLEDPNNTDKHTDFEKSLLQWYTKNISPESRKRELEQKEDDTTTPPSLPVWVEKAIRFFNRPAVINISIFLLFFITSMVIGILFGCAGSVGGVTNNPILCTVGQTTNSLSDNVIPIEPVFTRDETISLAIGHNITHCNNNTGADKYCYIDDDNEHSQLGNNLNIRTVIQLKNPIIKTWDPLLNRPAILTNRQSISYHLLHDGNNASIMIDHNTLIKKLEALRLDEEKRNLFGNICICPAYLDIYGNITFFYNDKDANWVVMYNPVIHRNNTLSTLVLSTIKYHYNSNFFDINQRIRQLYDLNNLEHYDSFVVEYDIIPPDTSSSSSSSSGGTINDNFVSYVGPTKLLAHMNSRLKKLGDTMDHPILLENIHHFEKSTFHLTTNNAICFTYCDALNKITMTKT